MRRRYSATTPRHPITGSVSACRGAKSNRDAVGARVEVEAGGQTIFRQRKGGCKHCIRSRPPPSDWNRTRERGQSSDHPLALRTGRSIHKPSAETSFESAKGRDGWIGCRSPLTVRQHAGIDRPRTVRSGPGYPSEPRSLFPLAARVEEPCLESVPEQAVGIQPPRSALGGLWKKPSPEPREEGSIATFSRKSKAILGAISQTPSAKGHSTGLSGGRRCVDYSFFWRVQQCFIFAAAAAFVWDFF